MGGPLNKIKVGCKSAAQSAFLEAGFGKGHLRWSTRMQCVKHGGAVTSPYAQAMQGVYKEDVAKLVAKFQEES